MNAKRKRTKSRRRARKLVDQAWEAAEEGNYDLAVKIVRRAVAFDPGNPVLWTDQGMLLKELGKDEKAVESFQAAITLAPDMTEAYAHLAEIRVRQGLIEKAVALQRAAVRHAPEVKRYAEALSAYRAMAGHDTALQASAEDGNSRNSTNIVCPIEQSLRHAYPVLAETVDSLDWESLETSLMDKGYALIRELIGADVCRSLREAYHADSLFARTVTMDKAYFGQGCFRYFASPIPEVVDAIRRIVYPRVASIANAWQQMLGDDNRIPVVWEGFRIRCAEFGQTTPTPLLLRYEAGGFNDLHRDIRGEIFFPIQMAIVLSPRHTSPTGDGEGFQGGEFLFCDQPVRKKSDRRTIPASLGDAILFCTRARLVCLSGVYGWRSVKHGVAQVSSGTRYVLGVPFHEYQ